MKCPFYIKVCSVCKRLLVASESNFYKKKHDYIMSKLKRDGIELLGTLLKK